MFRANLGTTFCDVAVADTEFILELADAILRVQRMHLEGGSVNKKSRTYKLVVLLVITKDVTDILTQKTLDAFPEFLHAVDVRLLHPPRAVLGVGRPWVKFLDAFLDLVVPRYISDKILNRRKCPHGLDRHGLRNVDRVQARHTQQLWHAVDLSRA